MTAIRTSKTFIVEAVFVVALLCIALLPAFADAQGNKPAVTGQERADEARGNNGGGANATTPDEDESEEAGDEEEVSEETDKPRGLERAAAAGNKPEAIRNQLTYIMTLIEQMRDAINGRGIGAELSAYIANGRIVPGGGEDEEEPVVSDDFVATLLSATASVEENDASTTADNVVTFELELSVTASGTDIMIPDEIKTEATTTTGLVFSIENASGTVVTTGDVSATLTSSATASSSLYTVLDGETETFTITVDFDPAEEGECQVQLESLQVDDTFYDLIPAADFESDLVSV